MGIMLDIILNLPSGQVQLSYCQGDYKQEEKLDFSKINDGMNFTLKLYRQDSMFMMDVNGDNQISVNFMTSSSGCYWYWPSVNLTSTICFFSEIPVTIIYWRNAVKRSVGKGETLSLHKEFTICRQILVSMKPG